jgi:hypothetical protein
MEITQVKFLHCRLYYTTNLAIKKFELHITREGKKIHECTYRKYLYTENYSSRETVTLKEMRSKSLAKLLNELQRKNSISERERLWVGGGRTF